jgi:hypothetical protein
MSKDSLNHICSTLDQKYLTMVEMTGSEERTSLLCRRIYYHCKKIIAQAPRGIFKLQQNDIKLDNVNLDATGSCTIKLFMAVIYGFL